MIGIGIPSDKLSMLLKAFSQVDASINRKYGGTGLGLAICVRLVELMGGTIKVESELDKGTTLSFTIRTIAKEIPADRPYESETSIEGKKVLVIDDNKTNQRILKVQIEKWKAIPTITSSAKEALEVLRKNTGFDLIITDMQMPEMSGVELAVKIKAQKIKVPVILLSSIADVRRNEHAHLFNSILTKPVTQQQLHKVLVKEMLQPNVTVAQTFAPRLFDEHFAREYPYKILIAEDNEINMKLTVMVLNKLGYDPVVAVNGKEVLEIIKQESIDIILMDVQMPEMNGLEATSIIRKNTQLKQPVIIAMTANAMAEDKLVCLEAGMDAYISKPFSIKDLVATLRDVNSSVLYLNSPAQN